MSVASNQHTFDFKFIGCTLICCLVVRAFGELLGNVLADGWRQLFAVVLTLSALINRNLPRRLTFSEQFVVLYSGLRGAVCYGLITLLDPGEVRQRDMYITTVMILICASSFINVVSH